MRREGSRTPDPDWLGASYCRRSNHAITFFLFLFLGKGGTSVDGLVDAAICCSVAVSTGAPRSFTGMPEARGAPLSQVATPSLFYFSPSPMMGENVFVNVLLVWFWGMSFPTHGRPSVTVSPGRFAVSVTQPRIGRRKCLAVSSGGA